MSDKPPDFICLSGAIFRIESIDYIKIDGSLQHGASSPWGEFKATWMDAPINIGDGSYEGCPRHMPHMVARRPDGTSDFRFEWLRQVMRGLIQE